MFTCAKCGSANEAGSEFCQNCGAPMQAAGGKASRIQEIMATLSGEDQNLE